MPSLRRGGAPGPPPTPDEPGRVYIIRLRGKLPPAVVASMNDVVLASGHEVQGQETVLTLHVTDEAKLRGLMEHLLEAGLEVVELTATTDQEQSVDDDSRGRRP